ncbi:MAG: alpha/beta hydrolase [Thermoplasmata archaeon]|nr:alpha/beta hydrolase [Thermoplasmata archaeon]
MPSVSDGGVRIHYEVEGDGPAVVVHTGAGGDLSIWRHAGYVEGLRGYRTILIDQRGRGRSDRPTTVEAHRMEWFVEDVRAVLDDVGEESSAFWGYSSGILVGIAFGGAHPTRLRALVGTGGLRLRNLNELPPVDERSEVELDVARGGVRHEVDARMAAENDRFPDAIDENVRSGDPLMHALDGVAWLAWPGPRAVLERTRCPILLLTGEKEDLNRETERTVQALPTARMVRIPGVGHLGVFYRSDLALPHALPFLQEHAR